MYKYEFENVITPQVNNGIGGGVSPEMWEEIELVYNNTELTKLEVADVFWNRTGLWSKIAYAVKLRKEAFEELKQASRALDEAKKKYSEANREMFTSQATVNGLILGIRK